MWSVYFANSLVIATIVVLNMLDVFNGGFADEMDITFWFDSRVELFK